VTQSRVAEGAGRRMVVGAKLHRKLIRVSELIYDDAAEWGFV
jgi:hypothetical protein